MTVLSEAPSAARAGAPPITGADRRAERAAAATVLAVRLGRMTHPAVTPPMPAARISDPRPLRPPSGPDPRRVPLPVDVLAGLLFAAAVPSDFAGAPRAPSLAAIITTVTDHYGISRVDLMSARRDKTVTRPRQLVMWLAAKLTGMSLPEIGRRIGGRDHTTVMHARRATEARLAADPDLRADVDALIALLTRTA